MGPESPQPPEADHESLAWLAAARGQVALDELVEAIRCLDSELKTQRSRLGEAASVRSALALCQDLLTRRACYRRRLDALCAILQCDPPPITNPPDLPPLASLLGSADAAPSELQRAIAAAAGRARTEAEQLGRQLDGLSAVLGSDVHYASIRPARRSVEDLDATIAASEISLRLLRGERTGLSHQPAPSPPPWAQDARLSQLDALVRRRREAAGRLAALTGDGDQLDALVKARVASAVEAAGGASVVATQVVVAMALESPAPHPDPELELVEAQMTRLRDAGVTAGPAHDALRSRRQSLVAQAEADRAQRCQRRRAMAEAMVTGALAGDESHRAALESIATRATMAFPAGFGGSISEARADRAALSVVVAALES
jgi:hypothetical protein